MVRKIISLNNTFHFPEMRKKSKYKKNSFSYKKTKNKKLVWKTPRSLNCFFLDENKRNFLDELMEKPKRTSNNKMARTTKLRRSKEPSCDSISELDSTPKAISNALNRELKRNLLATRRESFFPAQKNWQKNSYFISSKI